MCKLVNPDSTGHLLETVSCKIILKELERLADPSKINAFKDSEKQGDANKRTTI